MKLSRVERPDLKPVDRSLGLREQALKRRGCGSHDTRLVRYIDWRSWQCCCCHKAEMDRCASAMDLERDRMCRSLAVVVAVAVAVVAAAVGMLWAGSQRGCADMDDSAAAYGKPSWEKKQRVVRKLGKRKRHHRTRLMDEAPAVE